MHTDEPRDRGPFARLADLLSRTADGSRPTSIELAELVWLARQMDGTAEPAPPDAPDGVTPPTPSTPQPTRVSPPSEAPAEPTPRPDDRVPLRLPAPTGNGGPAPAPGPDGAPEAASDHTPLRVPVPPMVTHPLALQRALRPLKRRVPSPVGQVIDEEATAHRIARLGGHPRGWLPVLRPAEERWLRLCLVYDAGPTMPIWRPLIHELHTALAQSGIFRTVELHRATPDGKLPPQAAHAPATGRTVVLLISDCMGPQWREGPAGSLWYRTLHRWASRLPLALIQPLPERLWRTTALPTTPGTLSAPHPASPSASLTFTPYAADSAPPPSDATPIPVLEPSPTWLSHWASLVADAGGSQLPGSVAWLTHTPPTPEPEAEAVTDLTPEDLVLRFRSTASPEAFRLAGHLAVGEPQLPVMRLVQAAVEERPRPQHLAEVILSGMLASGAGAGAYEFRDGVRELLLRTLPRTARGRTRELLARVGGLIDERAGVAPGELRAVAPSAGGGAEGRAPAGEPFATVAPESVRQLGGGAGRSELVWGRYRLMERLGKSSWLAQDIREEGRALVVQRFPRWPRGRHFTQAAEELSRFRHTHVATVRDYVARDDVPFLVVEFVDGRSLAELLADHPDGLPYDLLLELIRPIARTVAALHAGGLAHGALSPGYVRLSRRGPVLCGFRLAPFAPETRSADLRSLGLLVRAMREGAEAATGSGPLTQPPRTARLARGETLRSAVGHLDSTDPARWGAGLHLLEQLAAPRSGDCVYSVLGPLHVTRQGHPLAIETPEEQALLCMLLLKRGRPVPYAELTEGIWGPSAPGRAEGDLRACAHRLAGTLAPETLTAGDEGYTLPLPSGPDGVDLFHCQRLAADAQDAYFAGDFTRSRQLVRSALELWRGTPLLDVPGPAALATRVTIAELRQSLLRTWGDLEGRDGDATAEDSAELADLLQEFPHTEDEVLAPQEELPSTQLNDLGVSRELPDDQPTPPGTTLTFEYLTRPTGTQSETLHRLGREISHLLITGGIGPDRFELRPRPRGWDVAVAPEVHVLHALTAALHQLPVALAELPHIGLGVTVTHEPDPTVSAPAFPAELRHVFGRPGSRAVVIVSNDLHDRLVRSGRSSDARFAQVPQSDDWYCEVTAPAEARPAASLSTLFAGRSAVILGFDGPVVPLFPASRARETVLDLMGALTEARGVDDALEGRPPLEGALDGYEGGGHPMDLLRAHQNHASAGVLRARLRNIEQQSLKNARPTPRLPELLNTLSERGMAVAVAGDCDSDVMAELLTRRGLAARVPGGTHGRRTDSPLLPDPDCLRRALQALEAEPGQCVMVGSSAAELLAARQIGLPFIGYRRDEKSHRRLQAEGCEQTVDWLASLTDAVRGT
ncbi:SAV_2336 N-terminal domain-related protein [Streptomyces sp. NBC_01381]|uniref:SAV_2336 N-terminal domain-related protein n=1 Tax=Streptomyces sp. NBC_01381 TaxID=2903845 RepID=UPI00224EAF60|nr:SAV_2336 N-terminal domain-related protein [Streptomyces sp. NBC_01381]MCX4667432.1 SAV_2336 N-terminal domain-related protein [Streptomyces sp. NBC_01381]